MLNDILVSVHWLAARVTNPDIRVIDCTTHMWPQPVGPSKIVSGRADYEALHLPGAQHVDMVDDLSDPNGRLPYTAIGATAFSALRQRLGISGSHHVVLYGQSGISTVTRAWFIFHLHGQPVSILDGGLKQWLAAGYPTASEQPSDSQNIQSVTSTTKASTEISGAPSTMRPIIANRETVKAAMQDQQVQLINALSSAQFNGTGGAHYGRPGRIPNSLNLPAKEMIHPDTGCFVDTQTLRNKITGAGITLNKPSIHYCGGGIAATTSAFVMHLLGATDWSIYDDSLLDWSNQVDCPMVCG